MKQLVATTTKQKQTIVKLSRKSSVSKKMSMQAMRKSLPQKAKRQKNKTQEAKY